MGFYVACVWEVKYHGTMTLSVESMGIERHTVVMQKDGEKHHEQMIPLEFFLYTVEFIEKHLSGLYKLNSLIHCPELTYFLAHLIKVPV